MTLNDVTDEPPDGVRIGDGALSIRLTPAGPATELGVPTIIEAKAGAFSGAVHDDAVGPYPKFRDQLAALYEYLTGTAALRSYDGFELVLDGDGRGAIDVRVEIVAQHAPAIRLIYGFAIDQTYLPSIIRALDRIFRATDD